MTTTWDEPTAKALAHFVAKLRPTWDTPGILGAIHVAYGKHQDFALVAHIAIDAATDLTARTPAIISKRDRASMASAMPTTPTPGLRSCRTCGRFHVLIDGILEPCYRHDPEVTQRGIAKVRGALNAAKAKTEEIVRESPKPKVPQHRVEANQRGVDAARDALRHAHAMPAVDGSDDAR